MDKALKDRSMLGAFLALKRSAGYLRKRPKPSGVAKILQLLPHHCPGCEINHRDSRHFAQERHGAASARVNFKDIRNSIHNDELDVYEPFCAQGFSDGNAHSAHISDLLGANRNRWINRHGVSAMDSRPLDVLHDPRNQNRLTIAYQIDFGFFTEKVLVNEDRLTRVRGLRFHVKTLQVLFAENDFHRSSTKDETWSNEDWVTHFFGNDSRFRERPNRFPFWPLKIQLFQQSIKQFPVFCFGDGSRRGSQNLNAAIRKALSKIDRGLSAELANDADRLFVANDVHHVFESYGFEIEPV